MSSTRTGTTASVADRREGLSELFVPVLLLAIGAAVLVDASGLEEGLGRSTSLGPKAIPYAIGVAMVVGALWLAVDVLRGGRGEQEGGEEGEEEAGHRSHNGSRSTKVSHPVG